MSNTNRGGNEEVFLIVVCIHTYDGGVLLWGGCRTRRHQRAFFLLEARSWFPFFVTKKKKDDCHEGSLVSS